jgi:hypothetical protein
VAPSRAQAQREHNADDAKSKGAKGAKGAEGGGGVLDRFKYKKDV